MSADIHLELTNVLTPDLFFKGSVPKELEGYRLRVFQAPGGSHTTFVLDEGAYLVKVLSDVPKDHIHNTARAVFMGFHEGFKAGKIEKNNEMFDEVQIGLPFLLSSDSDVF